MRVLLYGMQSSGASILAFTLAQKRDSVAFVDIWNMFAAPDLPPANVDAVAKAVVTSAYGLEAHRRRFRPDLTYLVLRHPVDNYESLFGKSYANESGLVDEKFSLLEQVFRAGHGFDRVLYYEDFVFSPRDVIASFRRDGWKLPDRALLFRRTDREIRETNAARWPGIDDRLKYGAGNIQLSRRTCNRVRFSRPWGRTAHLPSVCPSLLDHYVDLRHARGESWHVPSPAVLSCHLQPLLRELTGSGPIPAKSERKAYGLEFGGDTLRSRVDAEEIVLSPVAPGQSARLAISGLPGRPFNRVRAAASMTNPLAREIAITALVEPSDGAPSVEKSLTLSLGDMRYVDLEFSPSSGTISLTLEVRAAGSSTPAEDSGVAIWDLRLDQVLD